jgi:hypothetical protein
MISCSLQFLSCAVHRVFFMLSTASEVDYVPAVDLMTSGLELTFFLIFFGLGGGATECRINCLLNCAHVQMYFVFCMHVCIWCMSAGILCELSLGMYTCACVCVVFLLLMSTWCMSEGVLCETKS